MITSSGASSMMPQLLSLIRGNEIKEVEAKLPVVFMEIDGEEYTDIPEISSSAHYINVLSIKTPLFKYDQQCGPAGTRSMSRLLKEWEANPNVVGVVLDIDCPGGQVSGLAEFADYLHNYSKPIVAYTDGTVASAAYYLAAACDSIIVNPNADYIGSIGTMLTYVNLDGIIEAEGGIIKDIYATGSPRKNEESRAMKNGSDALILKNILDPARDKFVADVSGFRSNIDPSVFEGAIYAPVDALVLNLVDTLGTLQTAFDTVVSLSKANPIQNSKNKNMNTKNLPNVQSVLGLDAPLASTEENGTYLNFEQLDAVEAHLAEVATAANAEVMDLQSTLAQTAEDLQNAQTTIAANVEVVAGIETSIDAMMTAAGLVVEGSFAEKIVALNAKIAEMGAKDATKPTNVIVDPNPSANSSTVIGGIDVSEALNN